MAKTTPVYSAIVALILVAGPVYFGGPPNINSAQYTDLSSFPLT
jgi:hypothetical protein